MKKERKDILCLASGEETESLINYIFKELPDEVIDEIDLDRIAPEGGGVARELVTTGAILTFATALAVPIFRLIETWLEQRRQGEARKIIYQAAKENPDALKILAQLEKDHSNLVVELAKVRAPMLAKLRKRD